MNDPRHDEFDHRMRALHAGAVRQVPFHTVEQLRLRRGKAAAAARPARRAGGWWLGAAVAAVFALAIGLRPPDEVLQPATDPLPSLAAVTEAADTAAFEDSVATLEEDPDLYLWLASQDGLILAME